eukprot:TRINITY_DN3055_c3_g2_i1.p1 TRINITY_DN3055_c3_g2~~TRINITY_DN3055_c3_g2_i1.p1  ORF type:complete len:463 (-),score=196.72 TRINITY_DN3055_c3_g2_i1:679-2067(-)
MYKTLPSSLRRKASEPISGTPDPPAESSVFGGIHLNHISSLLTGGMSQLLGQFRRKPTSPSSPSSASIVSTASSSSSSAEKSNSELSVASSSSSSSSPFLEAPVPAGGSSFEEVESFELVELSSLTEGHTFRSAPSSNPTWCDHCGQIIWGIYDNVGSKCVLCDLTCHTTCTSRVRLNCHATLEAEEGDTLRDVSELSGDEGTLKSNTGIDPSFEAPLSKSDSVYCLNQALDGAELLSSLESYNAGFPQGQKTLSQKDGKINGFIRVTMNLRRPINVIAGVRPPSIYHMMEDSLERTRNTLSTFHLAPNTVKAIHVDSEASSRDVIRFLLAKFRIADNPHKYALYERYAPSSQKGPSRTLGRIQMRRIAEDEIPLLLALRWAAKDLQEVRSLVLQENDPGEICWEAFTLPELKNFLIILDREEAWYKKSIHEKYDYIRNTMEELLDKKRLEIEEKPEKEIQH